MLPYDGIIRTGSKGVSHFVTKTPSEGRKVLESLRKGKQALTVDKAFIQTPLKPEIAH